MSDTFQPGDLLRITADNTRHGFEPGTIVTVVRRDDDSEVAYLVTTRADYETLTDDDWEQGETAYVDLDENEAVPFRILTVADEAEDPDDETVPVGAVREFLYLTGTSDNEIALALAAIRGLAQ